MTLFNADWSAFWQTASHMSWYEIAMLCCFGASWPSSIAKMIRTQNSEGKSRLFLVLVMIGYICGIGHKLFIHLDVVILLYVFLFFVVLVDLMFCIHYRHQRKKLINATDCPSETDKICNEP